MNSRKATFLRRALVRADSYGEPLWRKVLEALLVVAGLAIAGSLLLGLQGCAAGPRRTAECHRAEGLYDRALELPPGAVVHRPYGAHPMKISTGWIAHRARYAAARACSASTAGVEIDLDDLEAMIEGGGG